MLADKWLNINGQKMVYANSMVNINDSNSKAGAYWWTVEVLAAFTAGSIDKDATSISKFVEKTRFCKDQEYEAGFTSQSAWTEFAVGRVDQTSTCPCRSWKCGIWWPPAKTWSLHMRTQRRFPQWTISNHFKPFQSQKKCWKMLFLRAKWWVPLILVEPEKLLYSALRSACDICRTSIFDKKWRKKWCFSHIERLCKFPTSIQLWGNQTVRDELSNRSKRQAMHVLLSVST